MSEVMKKIYILQGHCVHVVSEVYFSIFINQDLKKNKMAAVLDLCQKAGIGPIMGDN